MEKGIGKQYQVQFQVDVAKKKLMKHAVLLILTFTTMAVKPLSSISWSRT